MGEKVQTRKWCPRVPGRERLLWRGTPSAGKGMALSRPVGGRGVSAGVDLSVKDLG